MTTTKDVYQSKSSHSVLSALWELCREVIYYSNRIDRDLLSDEDLDELDAIDRITVGYGITLQEIESADDASYPMSADLKKLSLVIQDHCYRSLTALIATINDQQGVLASPIILLDGDALSI